MKKNKSLPLSDIKILELSHAVMGPTCGLVLADMGAEVIKIEPAPHGEPTRKLMGFGSGFFPFFNRNKKSLTLNLKDVKGKEALEKLIAKSDVLIENYGPGTIERLGFGWDEVQRINPRIIFCSLKGFMPGPYEKRPAMDEVVQMMAGLAYMTGPRGNPLRAGASVVDIMGGSYGAIAILGALHERESTGKGQKVVSSLYESTAFLMGQHMAYQVVTGEECPPMPHRVSSWSIYDKFLTRDDQHVFIGVISDQQWQRFARALHLDQLLEDPKLATNNSRIEDRARLIPLVADKVAGLTLTEAIELCENASVTVSPIQKPAQLFEDEQMNESGSLLETVFPGGTKTKMPKLPIRIGEYDLGLRQDVPEVNEHGREILHSLGYSSEEIEDFFS